VFGNKLTMEGEGCYRVRDAISKLSMYIGRPRKSNFRISQHNLSIRQNTKKRVPRGGFHVHVIRHDTLAFRCHDRQE